MTLNLDGVVMRVSATAQNGVVDSGTRLHFVQRGSRVLGRYNGGSISRGYLVGEVEGAWLRFRYVQCESSGQIHGGSSTCEATTPVNGGLRLLEHFRWRTREGSGTNVFETE